VAAAAIVPEAPTPEPLPPPGEGIFLVRADGGGLRRLGPATRFPPILPNGLLTGTVFSSSPDGRSIALIDLGPDAAGLEAPQIFLLDLRSGHRTQLTHVPPSTSPTDPGMRFAIFADKRTITFYTGSPLLGSPIEVYRVRTDGSASPEQVPRPPWSQAPTSLPSSPSGARTRAPCSYPFPSSP
jgi:hypothetical protein